MIIRDFTVLYFLKLKLIIVLELCYITIPLNTNIRFAHNLFLPIPDSADFCYLDFTEEQLNELQRLQNLYIRFILGLWKYETFCSQMISCPFSRNLYVISLILRRFLIILKTDSYFSVRLMAMAVIKYGHYSLSEKYDTAVEVIKFTVVNLKKKLSR